MEQDRQELVPMPFGMPSLRNVLSQIPVAPFAARTLSDLLPAGLLLPDELLGLTDEEEQGASGAGSTRARRQQARGLRVGRGGYRSI